MIWILETLGKGIVVSVLLLIVGAMAVFAVGAFLHLCEDPSKIKYGSPILVVFVVGLLFRAAEKLTERCLR